MENKTNSDNKCFLILGMHRSGTSYLAGTLEEAGVYLGTMDSVREDNQKGNKELPVLQQLHDLVLKNNGGSWDLPPYNIKWTSFENNVRKLIVSSFKEYKIWGLKDPRLLFTLDSWFRYIDKPILTGIFRHPAKVYDSLKSRNGFSERQAFDLWIRYNRKLMFYHKKHQFPLIEFSSDIAKLKAHSQLLINTLGLQTVEEPSFIAPDLIHHSAIKHNIPREAKYIYDYLCAEAIC